MTSSKTGWLFLGSVFGLTLAVAAPAVHAHGGDPNLAHSCVNNSSGEIKIVAPTATCKTNETAVDWSITGPAGPRLTAVDANSREMGPVISIDTVQGNSPWIALSVGDFNFALELLRRDARADFYGGTTAVSFDGSDCTGTPFVRQQNTAMPLVAVGPPGNTVYRAIPGAPLGNPTVRSSFFVGGACTNHIPFAVPAFPGEQVVELDTLFTPPFSVR